MGSIVLNLGHYLFQARIRLYAVRCLFKDKRYLYGGSFYPNEKHKSRIRIFLEQLLYVLKYGVADDRYFLNGVDRKDCIHNRDILDNAKFKRIRNRINSHPITEGGYDYLMILRDKFHFNQFLSKMGYPIPVLRLLLDRDQFYNLLTGEWKPLEAIQDLTIEGCVKDSSGIQGRRVSAFKVEQKRIWLGEREIDFNAFKEYCLLGRLIVEDRIVQHAVLSDLNSTSVNSLRIVTVNDNGNIDVFAAFIRIGAAGSFTDNVAQGGSSVNVDLKTGRLESLGWIRYPKGVIIDKHPGTTIEFKDLDIPFYDEAVKMSKALHRFLYHIHSVGWDIAITESGPCFIEGNDNWGLPFQGLTGGLKADFERMFKRLK